MLKYILNNKNLFTFFISIFLLILSPILPLCFAHENLDSDSKITIEEQLGKKLPDDITFTDETGKSFTIKELINNKPTIISFVYYNCPGICNEILQRLADTIAGVNMTIGKDYSLLSVSIDPADTYSIAMEKKKELTDIYNDKFSVKDWRFLVSNKENIHKLSEATGFYFKKEKDGSYSHPSAIVFVSPEGKITKYMYGSAYLPVAVKMSINEAKKGQIGPSVATVLEFCFNYDPESRRFVFDITRITGIITIIIMLGILVFLLLRKKKP